MKIIFCLLLTFFITPIFAQQEYYSKKIGWTVTIPGSFILKSIYFNDSVQKEGKKNFEQTNDIKIDVENLKDLIFISKGELNYFDASIRLFNKKKEGNYDLACKAANKIIYKTIVNKLPDNQIDSLSKKDTGSYFVVL